MQRVQQLLRSDQPIKWLFYGDSITHGAYHTFGWRDYTELFSERIRYELNRREDIVIKSAMSGNTTRDLLERFEWRVQQFSPHVVFIMIGMNDCAAGRGVTEVEFAANLTLLGRRIRDIPGALRCGRR